MVPSEPLHLAKWMTKRMSNTKTQNYFSLRLFMLGKDKWLDIGRVFDQIYSSSVRHLSPIYWLSISWYVGQVSALYQLSFIRFKADNSADGWLSVENQSSVGYVLVGYWKSIGSKHQPTIVPIKSFNSPVSVDWYVGWDLCHSTLSTMDRCSPNTWLTLGQYWLCICRVLVDILAHGVGWHYLASMIQVFEPQNQIYYITITRCLIMFCFTPQSTTITLYGFPLPNICVFWKKALRLRHRLQLMIVNFIVNLLFVEDYNWNINFPLINYMSMIAYSYRTTVVVFWCDQSS